MRNILVSVLLQPKALRDNWRWIPELELDGWHVKGPSDYNVSYFNFSWLNFQIALDNER